MRLPTLALAALLALPFTAAAQTAPTYDAELAKSLGADERGMRQYVLVILKAGPRKMPAGEARSKMFEGHFANMGKLAGEKKGAVRVKCGKWQAAPRQALRAARPLAS